MEARRNTRRSATAPTPESRTTSSPRLRPGTPSGKTTGFGRLSSRHFAINAAWPELSLTAVDLLARARTLLLDGEPATAEPKKLRYRILHTAARITRAARRIRLRVASAWPWRHELTLAFARLAARPRTVT
ncbi:transposase [Kitasatospora sp. NPDC088548]|uniref:transposase n=1 Tax=Kitasatospora sp. NPDC088548 TaxID=3364075 RepID=UPI0037F5EA2E